jgi:O-antigen/teichoic acid export membrane protein
MSRVRRAFWGVGDQGLSSLTNFLLAVVLARNLDLAGFGAASIGFAVYTIALSTSRAIVSEPFTVRHSDVAKPVWRQAAARSTGVAVDIGIVAGLVLAAVGAVMLWLGDDSQVGSVLLAVAVVLPGLLLQDAWRFVFFADHRPRMAFLNDAVWGVALIGTLGWAIVAGVEPAWVFVLAWGIAGALAGVFGLVQARLWPSLIAARDWWREHRDLITRYFVESLVLSSASQSRVIIISAIGGLALAGAIRLGQVVMNAIHPLTQGLSLTLVPEAVGVARGSLRRLDRMVAIVTVCMAAIPFAWGVAAYFLPVAIGTAIFGSSWSVAREAIPGLTLVFVAAGLQSGALMGLRATAAASQSMRARIVTAIIAIIGAAIGASTGDVATCALIMGIASMIGVPVWWTRYLAVRRQPDLAGVGPKMANATPMD